MYNTKSVMELSTQKTFYNRTFRYIAPSMLSYEESAILKDLPIIAWGIGDYAKREIIDENFIYALLYKYGEYKNIGVKSNDEKLEVLAKFIDKLSDTDMYGGDYPYLDTENSDFHMICFKIHREHENLKENFLKGHYSKMYSEEFLEKSGIVNWKDSFSGMKHRNKILASKVLTKDKSYKKHFIDKIKSDFHLKINLNIDDVDELDYPPIQSEEYFNYEFKEIFQ